VCALESKAASSRRYDVLDGDPGRWNSAADERWIPALPGRVAEVVYDQMQGGQLDVPVNSELNDVLESR